MSIENNDAPTTDYTVSPDDWALVEQVKNELTRQRDKLAKAHRMYEADEGEGIDPRKVLEATRAAIRKAWPEGASTASDETLVDVTVRELIACYWEQVKQRKNTASTGFSALNEALSGGIETKRLVMLLGAPNTGKTTFAHQVADHIADSGRPVLYITSEDAPSALVAKTLARIGSINYTAVLKGWQTEEAKINRALALQLDRKSSDRLRYLDANSGGVDMEVIREKAVTHFEQFKSGGPGVLVVDYLQRIARAIKTRHKLSMDLREVVTLITEQLRAVAVELDWGVLAIASQNRTGYSRSNETGALASAKESGDIEYTCDVLMALSEDKDKSRVAPAGMMPILLSIDKNRQGKRGVSVALDFWPDRQQFSQAEE